MGTKGTSQLVCHFLLVCRMFMIKYILPTVHISYFKLDNNILFGYIIAASLVGQDRQQVYRLHIDIAISAVGREQVSDNGQRGREKFDVIIL